MLVKMRNETIAIHGGYECRPHHAAVAVPIYQTVAYAFESAEHGAALFNLEVEGYRYTRISNPTNDVLEQRVAALEGGVGALSVSTGQAALCTTPCSMSAESGRNIVSVPAALRHHPHSVRARPARARHPGAVCRKRQADRIEELIDDDTRAVFCESVGNPAGNICDLEALAQGRA